MTHSPLPESLVPAIGRRARRLRAAVLALGLLATGPLRAQDPPPAPAWPLDLPTRYLTSNFMEYRPGRFHAGLDFKTNSCSGFAARAVEDGCIRRLRVSPTAYGRVLYLEGISGRTYVYAHLERFNDVLGARVAAARAGSGTYRCALEFAPGEVPVRRGEVLALTGQSGTGGPHLHFEVRDEAQRALNPLEHGFAVADRLPPVIRSLRALPADPAARLEGQDRALVLDGPLSGDLPPLRVSGPVAFSASLVDASDIAGHRLEPWLIEVRLDGETVYSCRNEAFAFADAAQQRLEWLELEAPPGTGAAEAVREHWLHRRPGITLPGRTGGLWYLGPAGAGLTPGEHRLEILAADLGGGRVSAVLPLLVAEEAAAVAPTDSTGPWRPAPVALEFADVRLTPFFETRRAAGADAAWSRRELAADVGDSVQAWVPLWSRVAALDDGQREQARRQGLSPRGPGALFLAADWPVRGPVAAIWPGPLPGDPACCAIYRWRRDRWVPAADLGVDAAGASPAFALAAPGFLAVLADTAAPRPVPASAPLPVAPAPERVRHGVTLPRWEAVPVPFLEEGSGLDPDSIVARCDGLPLIPEPDLPRDRLLVELPDAVAPGPHVLALRWADAAGNAFADSLAILCLPTAP